jgi:glyoxylate reductase
MIKFKLMKVLITRKIPRAGIELLRKHPSLELDLREGPPLPPRQIKKAIKGASAVISVIPDKITEEIMKAGEKELKLVANYAVGYDNIDTKAATKLGIYVANTPGNLTEAVGEFSLAMLMSIGRRIVEADKFMRTGKYKYWDPMVFLGPKFMNKTIGIIGFGRIGQYLAKISKGAFNMRVLYSDLQRNDRAEAEIGAMYVNLDDLLENSDFVSIHVPLLPSTRHLITERELKKMKPTAYLVNTARGPIIDEDALYVALKENWIQGAAIDVYEEEPKMYEGLRDLDNVVVTPHIGSATREARIDMARMAAENVIEVLINKKPPKNLVNKDLI